MVVAGRKEENEDAEVNQSEAARRRVEERAREASRRGGIMALADVTRKDLQVQVGGDAGRSFGWVVLSSFRRATAEWLIGGQSGGMKPLALFLDVFCLSSSTHNSAAASAVNLR